MNATLANLAWLINGWGDATTFRRGLAAPVAAPMAALRRILAANVECELGRSPAFGKIQSVDDFRRRVQPADYEKFAPSIARMAAGEQAVLTAAPVTLFEPSSGSTAAAKLIPYTAALQREFQMGLAAWVMNVYTQRPRLLGGPGYWSVSPLTQGQQTTSGGIPIGFEDDSAYLGTLGRLVGAALVVPARVKELADVDAFRYATLRHLLAAPGLRLISVWNPTFLTLLLDAMAAWWPRLVEDVATGTLTLPGDVDPELHAKLSGNLRPAAGRARGGGGGGRGAPARGRRLAHNLAAARSRKLLGGRPRDALCPRVGAPDGGGSHPGEGPVGDRGDGLAAVDRRAGAGPGRDGALSGVRG